MLAAAEDLKFEEAAMLRDELHTLLASLGDDVLGDPGATTQHLR